MTIPIVTPANCNGQNWLNTTNQTVGSVAQLTSGSLIINNNIIFANTNVNAILQGSMIANNLTINPDSNNLLLQTSNAVINGSIFITGQNTSLFVNNTAQFLSNVTTTNLSNFTIGSNINNFISQTLNVTNNVVVNNLNVFNTYSISNGSIIIAQNASFGNATITNGNNSINNANILLLNTGNLIVNSITIGNNLSVNGNVNITNSSPINLNSPITTNAIYIPIGLGFTNQGNIVGGTYTGNPSFANGATTTTQSTNDNSGNIATTAFAAPTLYSTGKNFLHNAQFNILQRGSPAAGWTANNSYTSDRWQLTKSNDGPTVIIKPTTVSGERGQQGTEIENLMEVENSTTSNGYTYLSQSIEGVKRLSGQQVTFSLWIKNISTSGFTPKIAIGYVQNFGTGGSSPVVGNGGLIGPTTQRMARYSVTWTMPSAIGKTINPSNDFTQIMLIFSNGAGLTQGGTLGQDVQNNSFIFGLCQLELGSIATPFELKSYQQDLALCQRFFFNPSGVIPFGLSLVDQYTSGNRPHSFPISFPTTMRATPNSTFLINFGGGLYPNGNQPGFLNGTPYGFKFTILASGGAGAYQVLANCNFTAEF